MSQLLKQSTAFTFRLGPFLDSTDGNTQENALTIAATDVLLSKAGGALAAKNEATALTGTGANAHYTCILNTTDTNTLGAFRVWSHITGALAVWQDFMVLPANAYDSIVAGSDLLDVNTAQWLGTACATPTVAGVPEVDLTHVAGVTTNVAALATNVDAILTDTGTTLDTKLNNIQGATFDTLTDSLEALRNRGDAAWITATGFALASVCTEARLAELDAANLPTDVGAAALATAIWNAATITYGSAGSYGLLIETNLDAAITTRSSHAAADIWSVATRVLTAGTNIALAKGTGVTGFNDLSAAQVNTECDTALTDYAPLKGGVAMTEAYAVDGATATPEQMLYMIWASLSEFAISGTTITAKKLDGITTAMTFTLSDATNPTSRTRAT